MISLISQRCGGMAPVDGVLEWKDTGSLGRMGRGEEEWVSSSVFDHLECMELCLGGWMKSQPRAYGSGLKPGQGQVTL